MAMLNAEMKQLIGNHTAGMVATVNEDGSPSVSPKATFVVLDDSTLAFGNIRSPGTLANLRRHPAVEVCFIDVLTRKAVRAKGQATIISKSKADDGLLAAFNAVWADYLGQMSAFVRIDLTAAQMILSPAYDVGHDEGDLRRSNLEKLNAL